LVPRQIGKAVDAGELLKEHRLAFHDRQGRLWTDVAEAQDGRPIRDHRDHVVLDRQRESALPVFLDREADPSHPRGIGHREVVASPDRHLVADFDLSPQVHEEGAVGDGADAHTRHPLEPVDDLLGVAAVTGLDGDVALGPLARGLDQVNRADVAPRVADCGRDATEHARPTGDLKADGEAVAGARRNHWVDSTPADGWAVAWESRRRVRYVGTLVGHSGSGQMLGVGE
jgi:hypothetical protein